jgi:hypothetical protein
MISKKIPKDILESAELVDLATEERTIWRTSPSPASLILKHFEMTAGLKV